MKFDPVEICAVLSEESVDFVVLGGFAAGTWNDKFGAAPADIVCVAGGVVTDLKRAVS